MDESEMGNMKDPMGDRLKSYEAFGTEPRALPYLPLCVRLDGRAFHTFTKALKRPFDHDMTQSMIVASAHLVKEFKPSIAFTQSDEISLIFDCSTNGSHVFGGKFSKINSVFAAEAAVAFYKEISKRVPSLSGSNPSFDCRTWSVPSKVEAANTLLWRWFDARKNGISALARFHFSHKELHKKIVEQMKIMLEEKGVVCDDFSRINEYGTFLRRKTAFVDISSSELEKIPEKHRPTGPVQRTVIDIIEMPPFHFVSNRVEVIFNGDVPIVLPEQR